MKFSSIKIIFVLTVAIHFALAAQSQAQTGAFKLSQEEQEWIRANPVVKAGVNFDFFPLDFVDDKGQYSGIANDLLQIVTARTGLQFEVEPGAWKDLVGKMNSGQIDLLPALYYSEERGRRYDFTPKYYQVTEFIFARDDTGVTSEQDLAGKTVAMVRGSASVDKFRQAHPEVRILELESVDATIHAVATYRADLLFEVLINASRALKQKSITNIRPVFTLKDFKPDEVYMATRKDLPLLNSIISKVLTRVPEAEKEAIISKWEGSAEDNEAGEQ